MVVTNGVVGARKGNDNHKIRLVASRLLCEMKKVARSVKMARHKMEICEMRATLVTVQISEVSTGNLGKISFPTESDYRTFHSFHC